MKRTLFIILAVVAVFVIVGVSFTNMASKRGLDTYNAPYGMGGGGGGAPIMEMPAATMMAPAPQAAPPFAADGSRSTVSNDAQAAQERIVIQNSDIAIVVKDPKSRMAEIGKLATDMGGYVVTSNFYQDTSTGREIPAAGIMIRVPSAKLDEAIAKIEEGAIDVPHENRSSQDVTAQYVDLQAQLKAKEAAEKKLLEILDQATKAEDVLAIYLQAQNVQTEIEQLKGQIKYLDESAALSAINVTLIAEESTQPIEVGPWKPQGAAKQAIQDLIFFFQNFIDFLIRFALLTLPALILIAIPLLLVFFAGRGVYRRVRKSRAVVEEKEIKSEK